MCVLLVSLAVLYRRRHSVGARANEPVRAARTRERACGERCCLVVVLLSVLLRAMPRAAEAARSSTYLGESALLTTFHYDTH